MPPKKRKAGSTAATATRDKRVRTTPSSIAGEDDGASVMSASGRPKRSTAGDPSYDQTRRRSSLSLKSEPQPEPKQAHTMSQPTKRGPGRPRKLTTPTPASPAITKTTTTKKPVGRPPRVATHVELPVRKRGRPKKEVSRYVL